MAIINGTNRNEALRGTALNDVLRGFGGDDTFYWRGGQGNDTVHGGDAGERYDDNPYTPNNPGGDRLILEGSQGATITFTTTERGTAVIGSSRLTFTGIERVQGTNGNDVIKAGNATLNPAHDGTPQHGLTISSRGGNDNITATRFQDIIDGGAGNDTIRAGNGDDVIQSSAGNDLVYGGAGNENMRWGNGHSNHNPGHDTIYGGTGNDLINVWIKNGYLGADNEAAGIPGVSVKITRLLADYSFDGTAETRIGGTASLRFHQVELGWTHEGNDNVSAAGARVAAGKVGIHFDTRWGHDRLTGSAGDDILITGDGRDTIAGGAGKDELWVGEGAQGDGDRDRLIFGAGDGQDTVYGFEAELDSLALGGRNYTARETADGTLLTLGDGDSILLSDVFDFI